MGLKGDKRCRRRMTLKDGTQRRLLNPSLLAHDNALGGWGGGGILQQTFIAKTDIDLML